MVEVFDYFEFPNSIVRFRQIRILAPIDLGFPSSCSFQGSHQRDAAFCKLHRPQWVVAQWVCLSVCSDKTAHSSVVQSTDTNFDRYR